MKEKLTEVRDWAKAKIATGAEPPWAWFQYMKLIEALDTILVGTESTSPMESSPGSASSPARRLRLVDSKCLPDNAPRHQPRTHPRLPM